VIASRWWKGSKLIGRRKVRLWLSFINRLLVLILFGIKFDVSNSFRIYNLRSLDPHILDLITSSYNSFFFESLFILNLNNYKIGEIPVTMRERTRGRSKLNLASFENHFWRFFIIYRRLFRRDSLKLNYLWVLRNGIDIGLSKKVVFVWFNRLFLSAFFDRALSFIFCG